MKLEKLNQEEIIRYLGGGNAELEPYMQRLFDACESRLFENASPAFVYKELTLPFDGLLVGSSIQEHLKGCASAVLMAATLGTGVDRLLRSLSLRSMEEAVITDAMASAAVEQVCAYAEDEIARALPQKYLTYRFSPGYGDYPIEQQRLFLRLLDAPRKIGLSVTPSSLLTPMKSVTAIIGVSLNPLEKRKSGCAVCRLKNTCKFRKAGTRCEF